MSEGTENRNGRALEKIIVDKLLNLETVKPTERCVIQQLRDEPKISELDLELKSKFEKSAAEIANFLNEKFQINKQEFYLDRLDDNNDSVVDMVLFNKKERVSFSIKHNNDSLKHNRPYSLIENGLDFKKDSTENIEHRDRLTKICNDFRELHPDKKLFTELSLDTKEKLYEEFTKSCLTSLEKHKNNKEAVANWFKFIMGLESQYIKIKVFTKKGNSGIFYEDFRDINSFPNKMQLSVHKGERRGKIAASWNIVVHFNNGYKFNNRLHNKSSRISDRGQISMAFDVKFTEDSVRGINLD